MCMSVVTHQRTEAGPGQRHGEGRHGNRAEVEDSGIDVQRRESLKRSNRRTRQSKCISASTVTATQTARETENQ